AFCTIDASSTKTPIAISASVVLSSQLPFSVGAPLSTNGTYAVFSIASYVATSDADQPAFVQRRISAARAITEPTQPDCTTAFESLWVVSTAAQAFKLAI